MIRETCGTLRGAQAHHAAGEPLCGWCAHAEAVTRACAEDIPQRPSPVWPPVTPEQAREHRLVLDAELAQYEADHPTGRYRPMSAQVRDELAARRRERGAA